MPISVFNVETTKKRRHPRSSGKMRSSTIREFGGGWNVIDSPVNLSTRYASVLKNWYRKSDGSQAIRFGTKYVSDIKDVTSGDILNVEYFGGYLITPTLDGEIAKVDSDGTATVLFNETIANSLPGAPSGWSNGLDICTFTEIKGSLILCNGIDKPLEVKEDLTVRYLQDLAIGTNINTPIGRYCTTVSDYLVIAGVPDEESVIYIGAKGTVGTFVGDDAPNDGISLDLGAYAPEESKVIRGVSSFRNTLYVHFLTTTLQVVLGEYDEDGNHVPRVAETIQKFGLLSHRCAIPVVNDLLFGDVIGTNTIRKNLLSGLVEPSRLSELIAPEYQNQIAQLSQDEQLNQIFAVHDRLNGHYMLFIPNMDGTVRTFVFTFNESLRVKAWSEFIGWSWAAATSSALGRVYFTKGTRIYQYGNEAFSEVYSADFLEEFDEAWGGGTAYVIGDRILDEDNDTVYICLIAHTSPVSGNFEDSRTASPLQWEEYAGDDIEFDWEFPWTDTNSRAKLKRLNNLGFDTQGTSKFDIDVFVDNIYKDEDLEYDPALTMNYVGGDSPGYGGGDQPYGGGRRTTDERLWSHPVKFKIMKLRLHGLTKLPLRLISLTLLYADGKYGR